MVPVQVRACLFASMDLMRQFFTAYVAALSLAAGVVLLLFWRFFAESACGFLFAVRVRDERHTSRRGFTLALPLQTKENQNKTSNPAARKCRSLVNALVIPSRRITTNEM